MENSFNIELLIKKILNHTSKEENDLIELWLKESENNVKYYSQLREAWEEQVLNKEIELTKKEIASSWLTVKSQMSKQTKKRRIINKIKKHTDFDKKWFLKVAAILLIGFMLVYIFGVLVDPVKENFLIYSTIENEKKELVLSDGSKVWLNGNSTLRYPEYFFKNKRIVKLNGEAFFEVERDESKPFIVISDNINVEVLGTSFNVNDKIKSSHSIVTVASGKVAVKVKLNSSSAIKLEKSEVGIFDSVNKNLIKKKNYDLNYLTWKTGMFYFKNNSLTEVLNDLSKYYNVKFEIKDNSKYKNIKFNSVFDNQKLEEILEVINATLNVEFDKVHDKLILVN